MSTSPIAPSIEQHELAALISANANIRILDVRRAPAFEKNPVLVSGAVRVPPDAVAAWASSTLADKSIPVVAYCVYGHEVSQGAAAELQALGFSARYLVGGISEWQASGGATSAA